MKNIGTQLKGMVILLITAILWGFAFPAQLAASEHLGALSYTGIRFAIGALPLIPLILLVEKNKEKSRLRLTVFSGMLCGFVMFFAIFLQQFSMNFLDNSGEVSFLTALYMLIVPLLGLCMGKFPSVKVWIAILLGCVGMFLLTVKESFTLELPTLILIGSAFLWAVHILVVGKFSDRIYPITFSFMQFSVTALCGLAGMFLFESPAIGDFIIVWPQILYGGLVSVGIAFTCQIIGQKYTDPAPAAIILSTESVFGAIGGVIMGEPMLTPREISGCVLIFIGIILSQIPNRKKKEIPHD